LVVGRLVSWSVGRLVGWSVGWLVGPHITLNMIFSAICGQVDLKFGRNFHIDLLFQFLFFFFLNSSSNASSSFSSSFFSEIKLIYNHRANRHFGKDEFERKWTP
jgi:hypothetical protein